MSVWMCEYVLKNRQLETSIQAQRAKSRAQDKKYERADLDLINETDYPRALE